MKPLFQGTLWHNLPITIIQDDNICGGQVDTQPTCTRREQEYEFLAIRFVILVNGDDPVIMCRASIDTAIF